MKGKFAVERKTLYRAARDEAGKGPQDKLKFRFPEMQARLEGWGQDIPQLPASRMQWACVSDLRSSR